ncbi:MAG: DUF6514 family protein [Lachnospiraceae bacterium]
MKQEALPFFQEVSDKHIYTYLITQNLNTAYVESEVYEYGIESFLSDTHGNLLSSDTVRCISSDLNVVYRIACTLKQNQVHPVHLRDVVIDLLIIENLSGSPKQMCA